MAKEFRWNVKWAQAAFAATVFSIAMTAEIPDFWQGVLALMALLLLAKSFQREPIPEYQQRWRDLFLDIRNQTREFTEAINRLYGHFRNSRHRENLPESWRDAINQAAWPRVDLTEPAYRWRERTYGTEAWFKVGLRFC